MTTLSSTLCAAPALLLLGAVASAQTSVGGQPIGLLQDLGTPAPQVAAPTPDVAAYLAEDEERGHRPLRYGAMVGLGLDLDDGAWTELRDGRRVWRLQIVAPGAQSVALEFDRFVLPQGALLYVYDEEQEMVLGGYTRENVNVDGTFVFEPFPGERLTLELNVPPGAGPAELRTSALIHDYRGIFGLMDGTITVGGDPGTESLGACLVDVNCPEGANWANQKRATMRTLSNGALCSGALLNNTSLDGARYVLTADHCGQVSSTVFTFRYERSGCGSGTAPTTNTVSGCTVLTTSGTYDSRLLRITPSIPQSYNPYYAGWTRTTANSTFAFAMGHPSGGPKKISIDNNGTSSEATQWRVSWNVGTLEGGSSGGPLFDQDGRVKGPACCVNSFVCSGQTAWFGKFSSFYTNNALAQWLDPAGTNPTSLNGFDPFLCSAASTTCFTSPNSVGPGALISFQGTQFVTDNNFTLLCSGLPPNSSGIYFYGQNEIFQSFGNGFRCVGNPVIRLPVQQASEFGEADRTLNLTTTPIQAGQTWLFQYWYRNPAGGGAGFNLSDALVVPFCL